MIFDNTFGLSPIIKQNNRFDELVAVSVETEPELSISAPRRLFEQAALGGGYDTLPGKDRFVTVTTPEGEGERRNEIRIILNWLAGLNG